MVAGSCRDCYIVDIVVVGLCKDSACYCMGCYRLIGKGCYKVGCRAGCRVGDRSGIVVAVVAGMRWSLAFAAVVED